MATATTNGFGSKLTAYRKRLGMSQRILAERVGLTPSHLSRIEHDNRKPPSAEVVTKMVFVLRLSRSEAEDLVNMAGYSPLILVGHLQNGEDSAAPLGRATSTRAGVDTSISSIKQRTLLTPRRHNKSSFVLAAPPLPSDEEPLGDRINRLVEEAGLSEEEKRRVSQRITLIIDEMLALLKELRMIE